jgi:hypothetical protein
MSTSTFRTVQPRLIRQSFERNHLKRRRYGHVKAVLESLTCRGQADEMSGSFHAGASVGTFTGEQSSAVQGELNAIVKSHHFSGSKRCQDFLEFIVRQALEGNYEYLTERFLGVELFGRSIDYDTGADSIVRVRANDVRRRLAQYYADHSHGSRVTIHLAAGTYVPEFQWPAASTAQEEKHASAEPSIEEASAPSSTALHGTTPAASDIQPSRSRRRALGAQIVVASVALFIGCYLGWWVKARSVDRSLYPWKYQPSVKEMWSGFLNGGKETDVVLSDASFQLIQNISKQTFNLDSYLNRSYLGHAEAQDTTPEIRSFLNLVGSKNFGNSSEFRLAARILALDRAGSEIRIYNSRDYSSSLATQDNVILIGSEYTNPWQHLFDNQLNFIETAGTASYGLIINKAPKRGEPTHYIPTDDVGYCVVAYLPTPEYGARALLIQGSSSEATEAGGDFVLSEDKLGDFIKQLHVQGLPYFEVLLKTYQAHGTPIRASVEAYRIDSGPR